MTKLPLDSDDSQLDLLAELTATRIPHQRGDGQQRKTSGMNLAAENTDQWWKDCADRLIAALAAESARTGNPFDSYSLTERGLPDPDKGCRVGPRFAAAAKAGLIVEAGYAPSRRPSVNGSAAKIWRGTPAALELQQREYTQDRV